MDMHDGSLLPAAPLHPGAVLQHVLCRYEIPQTELAQAIAIQPTNLSRVIHGHRSVNLRLARLLALALGTRPEFWLERQLAWDLAHAEALPPVALVHQLVRASQARPKFWLERELALELGSASPVQAAPPAPTGQGTPGRNAFYLRREPDREAPRLSLPDRRARRRPTLESAG